MSSPRAKVVALPNPSVTSSPLISPEDLKTWPVSQVVDSLYSHRSRVEAFKPIVAAEKALELELVRRCEDQPADAIVPLGGRIAFANLGPKPNKRVVTSPAKLFRLMKKYSEDAFQSIC